MKSTVRLTLFALMLTFMSGMIFSQQTIEQGKITVQYKVPAECQPRDDYMMAFMNHMGQQASVGWIADQMDEGAQMLTHCLLQGVILVIPERNEMIDAFAVQEMLGYEPIDGSGASLYPSGPVSEISKHLYYVDYKGKLSGVTVKARKISMHLGNAVAPVSVMAFTPESAEEVELLYGAAEELASGMAIRQYEPLSKGVLSHR